MMQVISNSISAKPFAFNRSTIKSLIKMHGQSEKWKRLFLKYSPFTV